MTFTSETKTIVIGGTSGIGEAVVNALSTRDGSVTAASRSTGLDVSDEIAVEAYFNTHGPVNHVVFTAGSSAPSGSITAVPIDDAKQAFDTKFWGSVSVAKAAAKHIRPGGTITLTSGFLARRAVSGAYVKTAMNAAIETTAKVLAKELSPIRVNVVSPGLTDTNAYAGMETSSRTAMLGRAAQLLPAGKIGAPEDLAQGYLFAIDNPFVTGAIIDIDGGALIN
jgi:NAD(P)-dependent dehydrogenase (short-subunit alcohol dehydrogenase family)